MALVYGIHWIWHHIYCGKFLQSVAGVDLGLPKVVDRDVRLVCHTGIICIIALTFR